MYNLQQRREMLAKRLSRDNDDLPYQWREDKYYTFLVLDENYTEVKPGYAKLCVRFNYTDTVDLMRIDIYRLGKSIAHVNIPYKADINDPIFVYGEIKYALSLVKYEWKTIETTRYKIKNSYDRDWFSDHEYKEYYVKKWSEVK